MFRSQKVTAEFPLRRLELAFSGFHFDPNVVDAFFEIENEILGLRNRFLRQSFDSLLRSGAWKVESS